MCAIMETAATGSGYHKHRDDPRMQSLQQGYNQKNFNAAVKVLYTENLSNKTKVQKWQAKDRVNIAMAGHALTTGITQGMLVR